MKARFAAAVAAACLFAGGVPERSRLQAQEPIVDDGSDGSYAYFKDSSGSKVCGGQCQVAGKCCKITVVG